MKKSIVLVLLGGLSACTPTSALAQSKALNRSRHADNGISDQCSDRLALLQDEERKRDELQADHTAMQREIRALERRLDRLRERERRLARQTRHTATDVDRLQARVERECSRSNCAAAEARADQFRDAAERLSAQMSRLSSDLNHRRHTAEQLRQESQNLGRRYQANRCIHRERSNHDATAVRRCREVYNAWQKVQHQLQDEAAEMPRLERQLAHTQQQLSTLHARANAVNDRLDHRCRQTYAHKRPSFEAYTQQSEVLEKHLQQWARAIEQLQRLTL